MVTLKENIVEFLAQMPVSQSQIPYDFQHDYLSSRVHGFSAMSRSEIAHAAEDCTEDEVYALAFLGALDSLGTTLAILSCNTSDLRAFLFELTHKAIEIAGEFVNNFNEPMAEFMPVENASDYTN